MGIVQFVFNQCNSLGQVFGFGAFEGAIIYVGAFTYAYLISMNNKNN